MVRENVTWGEERIADELSLKLGICVHPEPYESIGPGNPVIQDGDEVRPSDGERS
jgi:hypothetical protein